MADDEEPILEKADDIKKAPETANKSKNVIDRDIVFYYSREHRLSRASAAVRELNSGTVPRTRLTTRLFGNRTNFMFFIVILVICGSFGLGYTYSGGGRSIKLGRNSLAAEILNEDGILILDLVKSKPKSGEFYTGAVDIAVSPVIQKSGAAGDEVPPPMFTHRVFFTARDSESYNISLPFEGTDFLVLLRIDKDQKAIKLKYQERK